MCGPIVRVRSARLISYYPFWYDRSSSYLRFFGGGSCAFFTPCRQRCILSNNRLRFSSKLLALPQSSLSPEWSIIICSGMIDQVLTSVTLEVAAARSARPVGSIVPPPTPPPAFLARKPGPAATPVPTQADNVVSKIIDERRIVLNLEEPP